MLKIVIIVSNIMGLRQNPKFDATLFKHSKITASYFETVIVNRVESKKFGKQIEIY